MASPAKKRKLNKDAKQAPLPSRGLEYFFSKQKQNGSSSSAVGSQNPPASAAPDGELTDEELARKLQAEWDKEVRNASKEGDVASSQEPEPMQTAEETAEDRGADESAAAASEVSQAEFQESPASVPATPKGKGMLSLQSVAASVDTISESIPFDESPLTFDPTEYASRLKQHWSSEDGHASYALLTRCFVLVSSTQSRIKIVDTLVNCLRVLIEADPDSLLPAVNTRCFASSVPNTDS
jgi:DNA ligase-1